MAPSTRRSTTSRRLAQASTMLPLAIGLASGAGNRAPAVAAAACGIHCGTERWAIKTLSDPGAGSVRLTPVRTTVAALVNEVAPDQSNADGRLGNVETQAFTVKARLIGYKQELSGQKGDRDFHIVLEDLNSPLTMIVEIPDPQCQGVCSSTQRVRMQQARADFAAAFPENPPNSTFLVVDDPQPIVEVTGVGLFDFFHGQTGVAINCVELHPVLSFAFSSSGPFHAHHDPAREPPKTTKEQHSCIAE